MTVKEAVEKLMRMCKREYDLGNEAGGFAYDMAQLLVRGIKDRPEEMIEWAIKRQKESIGKMGASLKDEPNYEYWRGSEAACRLFLDQFEKFPNQKKVIDDA